MYNRYYVAELYAVYEEMIRLKSDQAGLQHFVADRQNFTRRMQKVGELNVLPSTNKVEFSSFSTDTRSPGGIMTVQPRDSLMACSRKWGDERRKCS